MLCLLRSRTPWARPYSTLQHDAAVVLRPYQQSCIQACTEALASGATRVGVSLPTGSGKTTVFLALLAQIASKSQAASKSLVIVNNVELAQQTAAQAAKLFPDWTIEIDQGSKHVATGQADMHVIPTVLLFSPLDLDPLHRTVATYQTLLQPKRLAKFTPEDLKAIIVDEAHHAAAPSYVPLFVVRPTR